MFLCANASRWQLRDHRVGSWAIPGADLGELFEATLIERAGTTVITEVYVPLDMSGVGRIPPLLAGRTFTIDVPGYEQFAIGKWDGVPLEVLLRESRRQ